MNTAEVKSFEKEFSDLIRGQFPKVESVFMNQSGESLLVTGSRSVLDRVAEAMARVGMEVAEFVEPSPYVNCWTLRMTNSMGAIRQ